MTDAAAIRVHRLRMTRFLVGNLKVSCIDWSNSIVLNGLTFCGSFIGKEDKSLRLDSLLISQILLSPSRLEMAGILLRIWRSGCAFPHPYLGDQARGCPHGLIAFSARPAVN